MTSVGVRWFGHVTEEHGGSNHVLAGSTKNRGVNHPILGDATIDVVSPFTSSTTMCAHRTFMLESLLKQA
jgi:hypothetical protein